MFVVFFLNFVKNPQQREWKYEFGFAYLKKIIQISFRRSKNWI